MATNGCALPWLLTAVALLGGVGCAYLAHRRKAGAIRGAEGEYPCKEDARAAREAELAGLRATSRYEVTIGEPGNEEHAFFDDKAAAEKHAEEARSFGDRARVGRPRKVKKVMMSGPRKQILRLE